ncbi:hypothetical protein [Nocardia lijiangensis]|uniref:hypothetical protein n=1 Tax=Nocardia lijiangensis TaxID=299618 RepID=UPI00082A6129|nr:hypothetical protein [Nocardia lijiangensis]
MYFILAIIAAALGAALLDDGLAPGVFFALAAAFVVMGIIQVKRNAARPGARWWAGGSGGSDDGGGSDSGCGGGGCGGGGGGD